MAKIIETTIAERRVIELNTKVKTLDNLVDMQRSRMNVLARNVRKIFTIWDRFFKGVGIILSIIIAVLVTYWTRYIYYLDGKWNFGVVVFGVLAFIIVVVVGILLTWWLVNKFLINKIEQFESN